MAVEVIDQVARDAIVSLQQQVEAGGSLTSVKEVVNIAEGAMSYVFQHNLNSTAVFWNANANWTAKPYEISRDLNSVAIGFEAEALIPPGATHPVLRLQAFL